MANTCEHCKHYKPRNNKIGFCKSKTKIMKGNSIKECFESVQSVQSVETQVTMYKKIIITNNKKIYIK